VTAPHERLTPASPDDLANALAFALRLAGRKRVDNADEIMAWIVAKRLVDHLKGAGLVVMKGPLIGGGGALGRGHEGGGGNSPARRASRRKSWASLTPLGFTPNKYRLLVIDGGGPAVRWRRSEANTEEAFGRLDHLGVERPRLE
jgi:hypothetical protein